MSNSIREFVKLDPKKFAAYTAAGLAAVASAETAEADITYRVPVPDVLLIQDTVAGDGLSILTNLAFGDEGSFNLQLRHNAGASATSDGFATVEGGSNGVSVAGFSVGSYLYASNVSSGNAISALTNWIAPRDALNNIQSATLAVYSYSGNSQFTQAGEGFLAVRYDNGGGFSYGWVRIDMSGAPLNSFVVVDYAFADPEEALDVGDGIVTVPEPGSLACLALGAIGLAAWRRQRNAEAA